MEPRRRLSQLMIGIASGLLALTLVLWPIPDGSRPVRASSSEEMPTQLQATYALTNYLPIVFSSTPLFSPPPENWLDAVNYYREMAGLPAVSENTTYSQGDGYHARYMVKNDYIGHSEDPANPWYTVEGAQAAATSNAMVSSNINTSDLDAINTWMDGPFHALGILDPQLHEVGFGSYRENIGLWRMGAALDVIRGLGSLPSTVSFPIYFPGDDTYMPLLTYSGETPSPLTSCPGYTEPSGPPIMLQIGDGGQTPDVTATSFQENGAARQHCVFDETNYANPNSSYQSLGRSILNSRDAIVIMPRAPLVPGAEYTVSITVNGSTYTWTFTAMPS
jgi:hypothetical protein